MNNFTTRILSGGLYVALLVLSIVFSPPWFAIAMALFCLLALFEIIDLMEDKTGGSTKLTALVYAGLIIYLCLFQQTDLSLIEYIIAFAIQIVSVFAIYKRLKKGFKPQLLFNTLYIWLPLASLAIWSSQNTEIAKDHLLFFFIIIWSYDSFAYLVGKAIGKRPIFPAVSPKKTVEGTIGGILITSIIAVIISRYFFTINSNAVVLAIIIILFSILGDFVESYLKRKLGVKDSGNIMPGHGGILDRIDSMLFASIPFVLLLSLS